MSISIFGSTEFRMFVQILSFIIALIVTQMVVVEWRRNRITIYKYLTLGFGLMFAQITLTTLFLIYSYWSGKHPYQSQFMVFEQVLLLLSYIYIAAAFTTSKPSFSSRFVRTNLIVLLVAAPLLLMTLSLERLHPALDILRYWHDLPFEVWAVGLLVHTVISILNSKVRMKKGLVIATCLLLLKHGIHFAGMVTWDYFQPLIPLAEHLLMAIYFYAIITTLHKEIVADLLFIDLEKDLVKEKAHQDTIRALINSLEAKDEYTRGHSDRVTEYAMVIGQKLRFDHDELTRLYYGAILHDIGKIGISEDILNNPLSLCRDEFDCMKKHPEIGATIVSSIDYLKNIAPSILYHHERFDGSGYPKGLKGTEIPLHARIIAITDALDAMSSTRTYRNSLTEDKTIREIIHCAGTQFDPDLVKILFEALGIEIEESDKQYLSRPA